MLKLIPLLLLAGCASLDYEWVKVAPASPKPWVYLYPADVDMACRRAGAKTTCEGERIVACAIATPTGCTIYLPRNPPHDIVLHEANEDTKVPSHCGGWSHK